MRLARQLMRVSHTIHRWGDVSLEGRIVPAVVRHLYMPVLAPTQSAAVIRGYRETHRPCMKYNKKRQKHL